MQIYIPICFYYFSTGRHTWSLQEKIYIPICFYYFLLQEILKARGYYAFTFQYVSIISMPRVGWNGKDSNLHSNMFLLFLYSWYRTVIKKKDLHSNMFLLFQSLKTSAIPLYPYLHSNMFLLFHKSKKCRYKSCLEFTFQYVSIISYVLSYMFLLISGFTFQYVSIISKAERKLPHTWKWFTFQYVYIISRH